MKNRDRNLRSFESGFFFKFEDKRISMDSDG